MAQIKGQITIDEVKLLEVTSDPAAGAGTPAPIGSFATINDGTGLYLKFGALDTNWIIVNTGVFGSLYTYNESNAQSTTTSTTYVNKMTVVTPSLTLGTYIVQFSCLFGNTNVGRQSKCQFTINAVQNLEAVNSSNSAGDISSVSTSQRLSSVSGVQTFAIDFLTTSATGGATAIISNAKIIYWRIS